MSLVPRESGALSAGDDMNALLGILVDRVPGVDAAVIFHGSGLALSGVATCLDEVDVVAEEASAMGAGLMQAATAALAATSTGESAGGFRSVWVRNDDQSMYCVQIGEDAYAAASIDPEVPAGLLMYRMDKWAKKARSAFEQFGEIDIPEEALPKRRHSHIQHDRPTLRAKEVASEDLGPIGAGTAPVEEASDDEPVAADSGAAGATALYAAAMAATTVGLADDLDSEPVAEEPVIEPVAEEPVAPGLSGDWLVVDVPEPPVREPVMEPALLDEPAAEERPALADAMEAWLAPPPPAAQAAPVPAPAPVSEPEVRWTRTPAPSAHDLSFAPAPSGAPVASFPPPVAAAPPPVGAPVAAPPPMAAAPAPSGAPVASFPPPVAAAPPPVGPPQVQFPRPAEAVWAPAPPDESHASPTETSPWAAYGGPPTGPGRP